MAFPGPFPDNVYSLRVYATGAATASFDDTQIEFFHPQRTEEQAWAQAIKIKATGGTIQFSFDGVNVHGEVAAGETTIYWDRHESGIALRGGGFTYLLEAW
jgi:hypothetical protein